MTGPHPTTRRPRRSDPDRRARILTSARDVVAEVGVAGVSHRRVATAADIPLGSMTYHFTGMDALLEEAFTAFADSVAARFEARLAPARTTAEARSAVVAFIAEDVFADPRELVLTQELYTLAARRPDFRRITTAWMSRSRAALERHFDPETARILDALLEGLTLHRALDNQPRSTEEILTTVLRITTPEQA